MKNVGIDIIEINKMNLKDEFIERYLTKEEVKTYKTLKTELRKKQFLASKWALKEAIFKALPSEHLIFNQINITKNQYGQPIVKIKDYQISLSLSHNQSNVVAIAICF
ncbi:MAG: holo-ACP synthase [Spiroplasma sp.]